MKCPVLLSWSGGKDSALTFYYINQEGTYEVNALLTTITREYRRISMHGVREELLIAQAAALDCCLKKIVISRDADNLAYELSMKRALLDYQNCGISNVAVGDIFLEDLRRYRTQRLAQIGMKGIFPLWGKDTKYLARHFIDLGFKAIITCVDSKFLAHSFVGRNYDKDFLAALPPQVDPCGENGEFHSFVYDGPIFKYPIVCKRGKIVLRQERFYYCDLIAAAKKAKRF